MNIFKKLREQANLSQRQVADELGYESAQIISNIERGVAVYQKGSIPKVAKLFNVEEYEIRLLCFEVKLKKLKRMYGIK